MLASVLARRQSAGNLRAGNDGGGLNEGGLAAARTRNDDDDGEKPGKKRRLSCSDSYALSQSADAGDAFKTCTDISEDASGDLSKKKRNSQKF